MFRIFSDYFTFQLLGLQSGTELSSSVQFFVQDFLKILFLIFLVVSLIAFLRTYLPTDKLRRFMKRSRFGLGNFAAATFGALTPFCSCSSIPIFIGFLEAEIPLGIAFSFLITSPLVNEVAFVIMGDLFGWELAFLYAVSGIFLGVMGGWILGSFKMDKEIILGNGGKIFDRKFPGTFEGKVRFSVKEGFKTMKKLVPYVFLGVMVGALIHGYVPEGFFEFFLGKYGWLSVIAAVVLGVPIYAGCSTIVPVIFSISASGVPLGTALAFMMSIAGLSLPEAIILKRVMSFKLLATFFGLVALGIIIIGYLFNLVSFPL
ncbi:permease [Patescibacteria group bacterium]|nr:permease [Patescibacteria group bacterium]